ncbi:acyl-CoA dehydrogenase family protein [Pseudogemmobacter sonorensis]|uniref:acyl-CoA dehydrogenase family protein n=1 Tax=Pseudogemmobacter sonorensis TaxID=2989681 RepID=UPI0036BF9629
MMDFRLTPEQELFRDGVRRTLEGFGRGASGPALRRALAELGASMTDIPEAQGGLGGAGIETALVMQEFGRHLVAEPFAASVVHAGGLLGALGLASDLVEGLMEGTKVAALASAEPEGAGDALAVATTARRSGDGFVLAGRKSVVIGAPGADSLLVTAVSADGAFDGIGLFRLDAPDPARLAPCRTLDFYPAADLALDGLALPAEALIACDCGAALEEATDAAIIATCAEAVGAMEAALWLTNDYLKTRKQFGVAIGSFQALQHRMADAFVMVEQARSSLFAALAGRAAGPGPRRRAVAAAKALIGRSGNAMGADMVQLHGGIGMTEEYAIGHYYRRLLAIEARFGNSTHHLRRLACLPD